MGFYIYEGPVNAFGRLRTANWYGKTSAVSPEKAINNLTYQYKKQFGLIPATKIELSPNKLRRI